MIRGGLVIGLGDSGIRVLARIEQVLGQVEALPPERAPGLLALHIRPADGTPGETPPAAFPLVSLAAPEPPAGASANPRQAARRALLADLARGVQSPVRRALMAALEGQHKAGAQPLDAFLVCASFDASGSAWPLDLAYLLRQLVSPGLSLRLHLLALTPEAFERSFSVSAEQRTASYVFLRELEALQRPRDWSQGLSLYGSRMLGGLNGRLTVRPFESVQVVDGGDLAAPAEVGAIPAAAEGILAQLEPRAAEQWGARASQSTPAGARVFSTFGVFTLVHPSRLAHSQSQAGLQLRAIEQLLPLDMDPDSGRPRGLAEPSHLRPDDPYGRLEAWLPAETQVGLLQDVLTAAAPGRPRTSHTALTARDPAAWQAFANTAGLDVTRAACVQAWVRAQQHALLVAIAERLAQPDPRLGAPLTYLHHLTAAFQVYQRDLQTAIQAWAAEAEPPRRGGIFGRRPADETNERGQREPIARACLEAAAGAQALTTQLAKGADRLVDALALHPQSAYNRALQETMRLERAERFESGLRCQQVIRDPAYEAGQGQLALNEFLQRVYQALPGHVLGTEAGLSSTPPRLVIPLGKTEADLADERQSPEQLAGLLQEALAQSLSQPTTSARTESRLANFLVYLEPRPDRLATRMAAGAAPQARLVSAQACRAALLLPGRDEPAFPELHDELQQQLGEVLALSTADHDRLTLLCIYDGLPLDALLTFHHSEPRSLDPALLRPHLLWNV